jgi:uncharacterized protein YcfJ
MKKVMLAMMMASMMIPVTPAFADQPRRSGAQDRRAQDNVYDAQGRYRQPRALSRRDTIWRGNDGRYHCRRDNGTTGLIIGGAAGALLGRQLAGSGNRTLGALLGGAGGALLGREIDRGGVRCQ